MAKEVRYARIQELLNVRREFSFLGQFARKLSGFGLCWDLACEEKPEHTLRDDLAPTRCRWKHLLAVWDRQSMEADTLWALSDRHPGKRKRETYLVGVEHRRLPKERFERAHATNNILDLDVTNNGLALLFSLYFE